MRLPNKITKMQKGLKVSVKYSWKSRSLGYPVELHGPLNIIPVSMARSHNFSITTFWICADTYTFSPLKFICSYEVTDNMEKGFSSCMKRQRLTEQRVFTNFIFVFISHKSYQISIIWKIVAFIQLQRKIFIMT
jgi:hypothetical protein